ncbi:glycoside hydrolase family 65 protein [Levilactobacillus bambusae]|uniref:Glycoside hydrolase family 65 protein n=1 Tax=Levilactobacillus bambusae TaxID=2024736 RepID=A0A2V1N1D2_9LACO|nr:glycosyl hydrolase family 65 protein [Levilactobacillus bambusae]PWG01079.1 glycoside hydrolase family 65 protein [Levilactobacillus bambusae]
MKTIDIKVTDDAMDIVYRTDTQNSERRFVIAYNPEQEIGENLENIRVKLVGLPVDAAIIEDSLDYEFSDTIVGINHQRIDIGLALANMLNIPSVSRRSLEENGLEKAVNDKRNYLQWHLDYYGEYTAKRNYGQEAMLTIGNGYFGLRGAYVEAHADTDNYPGTYIAGVYDKNITNVNGRDVENEDLVNMPNAQALSFGIDGQNRFEIKPENIQDIYRSLDLRTGILTIHMMIQLATGQMLRVVTTKVADMIDWHNYAIKYEITPLNFSGAIQIYSTIDGGVVNSNVERYRSLNEHHLHTDGMSNHDNEIVLTGHTLTSNIQYAVAAKLAGSGIPQNADYHIIPSDDKIQQTVTVNVETGNCYTFEKAVSMATSRETTGDLEPAVEKHLRSATFNTVSDHSKSYWKKTWSGSDIVIDQDLTSQKLTRVNIFHMYVTAAAAESGELDVSVGSRGLHGEAYRGHIFWDEMFDIPFYTLHAPKLARQLLMYRYRRLDAARENAKSAGYSGAMFPWQSGLDGDEQSQVVHLNPLTNTWDPDNSHLQRHVSLSVAYNVIMYTNISGDKEFMNQYGLDMLESIARFWLSIAKKNEQTGRYSISGVMGPDEFHENYPNSDSQGLQDNAYTNIMVAWLFRKLALIRKNTKPETLKQADEQSGFTSNDVKAMDDVAHHLNLEINRNGIIAQFAGYFNLETLNFENYRRKYGDISRIDRILKAQGKTPDAYQVAKQADTLMPIYNLTEPEVRQIIKDMGYDLPANSFSKNLQFYLARTTHGSTLSRIVYSVLDEMDNSMDASWNFFSQALLSDYYDIQGGTTAEGIHLGVMGAVTLMETRNYAGFDAFGQTITINPHMPDQWQKISFQQLVRGINYKVIVSHTEISVTADQDTSVVSNGETYDLLANKPQIITYNN